MLDQLIYAESNHELAERQPILSKRSRLLEEAILGEARQRLHARGCEELRSITCEYHEGMLILRGRLSSHYLKQLAQESIRNQPGVTIIVNATDVTTLLPIHYSADRLSTTMLD